MKMNEQKNNYMLFSRSKTEVATRLSLNGNTLDRIEEVKLVGVWITTWLECYSLDLKQKLLLDYPWMATLLIGLKKLS
jgi:hypothetical protein